MALTVTNEIFVTVAMSKSSIRSSWSCVNVPSRRLNRTNCARAMSLASPRESLISSRSFHSCAEGLIEDYAHYRRGEATSIATGIQDAIGKQPRAFYDFARDYVSDLL